jgi:hypothetical protein
MASASDGETTIVAKGEFLPVLFDDITRAVKNGVELL